MRYITSYKKIRAGCAALLTLCSLSFSGVAFADMSQFPLFLQQSVKPNIMFTLDNSGSMAWGSLTGADATAEYNSTQTRKAYHSSGYNQIYYNPATTYTPAVDYQNVSMGNGSPTAARIDAYPTAGGTTSTVNLKTICYATSTPTLPLYDPSTFGNNTTNCKTSSTSTGGYTNPVSRYAFYYNKLGTLTPDGTSGQDTTTNYTRIDIISTTTSYPKAATRTDCAGSTCTYDEEIQNFANWFSYYRTRIMMAKTAMGQAFASLDPDISKTRFRVGFNTINKVSGTTVTYNNNVVADGDGWLTIRDFDSTQKQAFFSKLYKINPSQGTPLRTQMDRIGKMYSKTLSGFDYTNNDPYFLNNPTDKTPVSCRPSFHIMTTDGYWNDSYSGTSVGNQDGVDALYSTKARGSYEKNSSSDSLADIAMYYYNRDIRTDLANNVPANDEDPSSLTTEEKKRQRMVTFTVGMGANGSIAYPGGLAAIKTTGDWPIAVGDTSTAVDDLWHAAINARGAYFSAKNPTDLREGLVDTLRLIDQTTATASTETASSALISTGTIQYEPSFKSGVWLGHLRAYAITVASGTETWAEKWNASAKLPVAADRNITTMKEDGTKVDFKWTSGISSTQQTALGSEDVLNYLSGDGSKEKASGGSYRDRATKLGDIVNSAPLYIKKGMDQGYSTLASIGADYTTFRDSGLKSTRKQMIYVGANDGMLHAFDATVDETNSGKELFAYVPASVYTNLKNLSSKEYEHQYFVDGQVTEGDAYIGGWKTVLLGSTGAGAKSVFAIDITDPSSLTKDSVLWEKSGSSDADLGYMLGEARAVTMKPSGTDTGQAGAWVAVFGNGYGSTNSTAKLYLKNLSDGSDYAKVSTDNAITANGLSAPALVYDTLNRVTTAYAGDLLGNLWKFDFSSSPTAPTVTKLFTAASGQPIIQRPVYKQHPSGGYMVMFGTGKYFDSTDGSSTDTTTQSLYGIWDKPATGGGLTRTDLQGQTLTATTGGATVSSSSVTGKRGWYVDLTLVSPTSGERAIANPVILEKVFVTKTLIPAGTLCSEGGDSYLYGINYLTGGANSTAAFSTLDVVKLSGGGTAGLQVVQKEGKIYVRTKKFGGTGEKPDEPPFTAVSPGFRTWRQIPVSY